MSNNATKLPGLIQESLLSLLAFDSESGPLVRNLIPLSLWERFYKEIAGACSTYWENYRCPPGEHFTDLIEDLCESVPDSAAIFRRLAESMRETYAGTNKQFVLDQATKFVRTQKLKSAIVEAVEHLTGDDYNEASKVLREGMESGAQLLDYGTRLSDTPGMLSFLDHQSDCILTGIKELDRRDMGPERKTIHVFVGLMGRGKSWWLIHLGKQALLQRLRVVHITLEMSAEKLQQRYCQSLFAMSKRPETLSAIEFETDELGRFLEFQPQEEFSRPSFRDKGIRKELTKRLDRMRYKNLIIKQFPTNMLTIADLTAYLDSLWVAERYAPDLLILDYADLMHKDPRRELRHELKALYEDLRGLAVSRNMAVATASQSNREGESARTISNKHVAEDISKLQTADKSITYSQTKEEKRLGLARLFTAKNRDDGDGQMILISQNYTIGQFVVSSAKMMDQYWDALKDDFEDGSGEVSDEAPPEPRRRKARVRV